MRITIDASSRVPASEQLVRGIRERIDRGSLPPGARVPPVRELARELGLAANTVAKAYRTLVAEGSLVGRGRHGTFVRDRLPTPVDGTERRLAEAAERFVARAEQLGTRPADTRRALEAALRRRRPYRGGG